MLQKLATGYLMLVVMSIMLVGMAEPANAQSIPVPYQFYGNNANTDGSPPPAPALASPANNATGAATSIALQWNASSGATSYQVQVSTSDNFTSTIFNQSNIAAIQVTVSALNANTTYYWRVKACNSSGTSDWSTTWRFTTYSPPPAPALSSPANDATGVAVTPDLQWSASSGATSYQVQVSTASDFNPTVFNQSNITATQVSVSPALNANSIYRWRVRAYNGAGNSDWSPARTFVTGPPPPPAPTLSSPANNATAVATVPNLQWNTSSGATSYQVQVSTASDFNTTVFDQSNITTTQVSVSPTLSANTTYHWRVKASGSSGTSDWSVTQTFTTAGAASPVTVSANILGQTGSFGISTSGVLSTATTVSSADGRVELSFNANTNINIEGQSLTATVEETPPSPPSNAKLVNAYNLEPNNTTFSPAMTLTLKYEPANLPQGVTESNLYIAFWTGTAWSELSSAVDTQNKTVSVQVSHFTIFALLGKTSETPTPPPTSEGFSVSDLKINPTSVNPGKRVTISAKITNDSGSKGSYNVVLKINGANEAEKEVTLKPKQTLRVTFTVNKESVGEYTVIIGDQSGSLKVIETATRTGNSVLSIAGTIALALGGLLVIAFAIILARRQFT